jgi:hypothetical protein
LQGLNEEQIKEYNKLNGEHEQIEIEIRKIRSDYSKISSFNTDTINILRELIQRKNLTLNSLENDDIKSHYSLEYAKLDLTLQGIDEIITQIQLDAERRFVNDNPFKSLFSIKSKRSLELKEQLKPFVQNLEIKKQIEALEKLIVEDKQKLSIINQIKLEVKNNERALLIEKDKIFAAYKENFEEYNKIVSELDGRTQLLKNDNLKIEGKPRVNFPRLREKILDLSDGRKASYNSYSIFDLEKTGITDFAIDDFIGQLKAVFEGIAERKEFALNSKVDLKNAIKTLLNDYFFDYWEVVYDNDTLTKMSTGKASFVILMLIVGLSKSKAPILIDQPEDNLDNRSITKDLVEYLRNKKLERQIILVTHNPNVVVNADAENIIVANQKGQNNKITTSPYDFDYVNGSIENTKSFDKNETDLLKSMGIREHIADIVEGGKEAFKKREKKYGFKSV